MIFYSYYLPFLFVVKGESTEESTMALAAWHFEGRKVKVKSKSKSELRAADYN